MEQNIILIGIFIKKYFTLKKRLFSEEMRLDNIFMHQNWAILLGDSVNTVFYHSICRNTT